MKEPIGVGLGELVISTSTEDVLVAYGLGSCLGICMVDPVRKIGGLLHAVLPAHSNGSDRLCPKYVDSGIEALLDGMLKAGALQKNIQIRMVGGANMLISPGLSSTFDIGTRNIEAARNTFKGLNLRIEREATGGHTGRTLRLYVGNGRTTVKVVGGTEEEL